MMPFGDWFSSTIHVETRFGGLQRDIGEVLEKGTDVFGIQNAQPKIAVDVD